MQFVKHQLLWLVLSGVQLFIQKYVEEISPVFKSGPEHDINLLEIIKKIAFNFLKAVYEGSL